MKFKSLLLSLAALVFGMGVQAQDHGVLPLSLDQCIRIALDDNPQIKVDSMEIERVNYARKEILGQLFPQINATGQYTRNLAIQTIYMNAGDGESVGIKMGRDNTYAAGFTASVPLVMPTLWRNIKLNDNQILQNLEKARATKLDLVKQVKDAYYALLLAHDSKRVLEASHETAQNHATIYQRQFELGTASEYDVLRANVAVTNLEPSILEAENTIRQLKLQLKLLMGMSMSQDIEPTETLEQYKGTMYGRTLSTDTSLVNNTSLKSLDLQADYLNKMVQVEKAAWIPTLTGTGNLMWNSMSMGSPFKNFQWTKSSAVGLTLSFPIFTGLQRVNKIKKAQVQANEMRWQRENLERSLHLQVQSEMDNINKSIKQIESNEGGVRQAEKANEIIQQSFKIGAASFIQLQDTDDALLSARLSYYQAIYNYLVAEAGLEYVLGNTSYAK